MKTGESQKLVHCHKFVSLLPSSVHPCEVIATIQTTENKKGTKQKIWRFSDTESAKRFHNLVTMANTSGMKLLEIFVDMDHQAKGYITVYDVARAMKRIGMPVDEVSRSRAHEISQNDGITEF